jgi:putative transposase
MARSRRQPVQQELPRTRGWGGKRAGAGRKPGPRPRTLHRARPAHAERHPVHLTFRSRREVTSLRAPRVFAVVVAALRAAQRDSFRIVHYSTQEDHLHLFVEATDGESLEAGARGLLIRIARAVNRVLGRRGSLWADRYHRRDLTTPREVHHALAYVLCNARKHHAGVPQFDDCSSASTFDGWRRVDLRGAGPAGTDGAEAVTRAARTWLLRVGWRRHGLLDPWTTPGDRESWRRRATARGWRYRALD